MCRKIKKNNEEKTIGYHADIANQLAWVNCIAITCVIGKFPRPSTFSNILGFGKASLIFYFHLGNPATFRRLKETMEKIYLA